MLKIEATNETPVGLKVKEVLERLGNSDDPFYGAMPMLERMQVVSMAHSAVKMTEL